MLSVLCSRPQDEDPGMAAGWVAPQVADPAVEGEHDPALIRCRRHDHRVTLAGEALLNDRVHVMAVATQRRGQIVRQVLVEFDSHAGSRWISSRASAAP
jgi:hypothetical protein